MHVAQVVNADGDSDSDCDGLNVWWLLFVVPFACGGFCLWCLLRWLGKTKAQEVHVAQVVNADGDSDSDCDG